MFLDPDWALFLYGVRESGFDQPQTLHFAVPSQKTLASMVGEGIGITYVTHHRRWVGMPSNGHYLIQSGVMNGGAGNKAGPQGMPGYAPRVKADE